MRCTRGAVHDVIIDLRPGSPTYCGHFGVVLDADNRRMLYVPEGFAHGFLTLTDETEVFYQISACYSPEQRRACAGTIPPSASHGRGRSSWSTSATAPIRTSGRDERTKRRRPGGKRRLRRARAAMHGLARDLYPICRSITGDGLRETLALLQRVAPLTIHEVPTGTAVLDWTVPREWNIRDAWIADARGDASSTSDGPTSTSSTTASRSAQRLSLAELRPHLHTLPDRPDWIPYRTSYYQETGASA